MLVEGDLMVQCFFVLSFGDVVAADAVERRSKRAELQKESNRRFIPVVAPE